VRALVLVAVVAACGSDKKPELPTAVPSVELTHDAAPTRADAAVVTPIDAGANAPRPERVVYDLVDNRHAAHRTVNGDLVVDAGDIGFAKYTRFGATHWRLGQTVGGKRMAVPDAIAGIEVPLTVEQARTSKQLAMQLTVAADVTLSVKINGGKAGKDWRTTLSGGTTVVGLDIDPKRLVVGENQIALEWKAKGKPKQGEPTVAIEWIRIGQKRELTPTDPRAAAQFDAAQHAIVLAKDAMLTYFVTIPDGANLVANVEAPCTVDVRARPSADAFAGGVLDAQRDRVDLTAMSGRVVALTLTAHDCDRATITQPRITLHGAEPVRMPTAPPPTYVVLWEMDGVRADSIPLITPGAPARTPVLDELAATSAAFRQVYVSGGEAISNGDGAVPDLATIAKPIQESGYAGAAVTGSGTTLVDEAIKQLDALRAKPTYLFVGASHGLVCPKDPADIATLRALYDSSITAEDAQLGRFIAQLRTWSIWDQTMLIVASNHGVELFEDGRCGNGSLRESVVRIPLVIHDPSRFPGGAIIEEGVNGVDIFATILDAIGAKPAASTEPALPRESLVAVAQGVGKGWPRPSYAASRSASVMRIGRWKITVNSAGVPTVGDLVGDPAETKDLSATAPVERRMLTDNLGVFLTLRFSWQPSWGVSTAVTPDGAKALDAASVQ
jgi:hypothetical protein